MCEACAVAAGCDGETFGPIHYGVAVGLHGEKRDYETFRADGIRAIHLAMGRSAGECDAIVASDRRMREARDRVISLMRRELGVEE